MKSVLIKDTTRAQREEIVRRALCDGGCDGCSGCGNLGGGRVEEMYRPYIEGKKELREINESYRANFVRGSSILDDACSKAFLSMLVIASTSQL